MSAGRREWIGLAVLAVPCLLTVMDLAVLVLAVPELSADLDPSATQLLWITDIYGFLIAGALLTMGTLGERIGRRRLLLIGSAAGASRHCSTTASRRACKIPTSTTPRATCAPATCCTARPRASTSCSSA